MNPEILRSFWWIPNALSIFRGFAVAPLFVVYFLWEWWQFGPEPDPLALVVPRLCITLLILLACISEWLDGQLARAFSNYGWETESGRRLDPLADKLLGIGVATGIVIHYKLGLYLYAFVPAALAILLYSGITTYLRKTGAIESPNIWAKRKTGYLMVAKAFFVIAITSEVFPQIAYLNFIIAMGLVWVGAILCWPAYRSYRDAVWSPQPAE